MNNIHSLEVVRYSFEQIDGQPKIVIHQVKALDKSGKYIKFIGLQEIQPHLDMFPVTFKSIDSDRQKYTLTREDLAEQNKSVSFNEVSAYSFRGSVLTTDQINKASKIIFVDGDKIKVLKQRMSS